jgi:hypothetical protein
MSDTGGGGGSNNSGEGGGGSCEPAPPQGFQSAAKTRSEWWAHFWKSADGKEARCKLCTTVVTLKQSSTTLLKRHMYSRHRRALREHISAGINQGSVLPTLLESGQRNLQDAALKWQVETVQPFSAITHPSFKDMVESAKAKGSKVPCVETQQNRMEEVRIIVRNKLKDMLQDVDFAITTDCWSAPTQDKFMAVTAHFITADWELLEAVLDCAPFGGSHTGERIQDKVLEILEDFDISTEAVQALVSDTASNVKKAGELLPFAWFGCANHMLELTCGKLLDSIEYAPVLAKCRKLVRWFKKSGAALEELQAACDFVRPAVGFKMPVQDVKTRWSSTYKMLLRLLELRRPLEAMLKARIDDAAAAAANRAGRAGRRGGRGGGRGSGRGGGRGGNAAGGVDETAPADDADDNDGGATDTLGGVKLRTQDWEAMELAEQFLRPFQNAQDMLEAGK